MQLVANLIYIELEEGHNEGAMLINVMKVMPPTF